MVRPVHSKRKLFNISNNNNKEQKENEPEGTLRNARQINSGHSTSNSYTHNLNNNNHSSHNNNTVAPHSTTNLNVGPINTSAVCIDWHEDVGTQPPCTPGRPVVMPMSERQQIALLRQMSSPSPTDKVDSRSSSPRTPNTPNLGRGVNKRNERGETPLHVASIKGDTDRVSQLITQGADVNATDYAGWSGLHEACNRGFYGVSKLLIEAGADVNAKGLDNDTPLHDACINNHFKLVRLLLKCGAGVDVVNRRGKSPRDVSRSPGIVSLIEQAVKGDFENFGSSSGEDIAPQATDLFKRMSRRTPPTTKPSDDKPGGPGSPRVTLRLQTGVARTPDKTRLLDNKNSMDSEDVYEFKCGKDESKGNNDAEAKGGSTADSTTDEKSDKRSRDGEQESDEEARSKRRKEDSNKESSSQQQQKQQQQQPQQSQQQQGAPKGGTDKASKSNNRSTSGGNNSTANVNSSTNSSNSTATKASTNTSGGNGGNSNISSTSGGTLGTSAGDKKSPMTSAANSPKPTTTKTGESSDTEDDVKSESSSGAGPKVPPLKIVLGGATEAEQSTRNGKNNVSRLPYVVNTAGEEKDGQTDSKEGQTQVKLEDGHNSNSNSSIGSSSEKASRITRSRGTNNTPGDEEIAKPAKAEVKVESPPPPPVVPADHIIHPRKRKIKIKEAEIESVKRDQRDPVTATATDQPATNCYETFLKIRKQIERRRETLRPVQPKPPQDFENYLMNRCSYVLAGNASSRLSVPKISPPSTLTQPLKELFNDQEKERYRLRLQHTIEKNKLVLSVEQEILRVHGRAARALANQALPFSVCTLLKDEEVYNVINPEQEKDGNARSRYNGRLFLSWLQDVDDKWEKIKEHMVLRHHHEAESLHAVQRMDWEWKMRELRMIEHNQRANIDDVNVPQVTVSDDFDLLPA